MSQDKDKKYIKIGAHKMKLVLAEREDGEFGEMNYGDNIVYIASNLSQEFKESTLIHEAMHAMNATMSHEFLDSLSEQMYQFLKDNGLWNDKVAEALLG